jgi:hypothetical protein
VVALDKSDVEILEMRGIAKTAPPGAKPLNVEEKKQADEPQLPESVPASHVPVQVKTEDNTDDAKETGNGAQAQFTRGKRR